MTDQTPSDRRIALVASLVFLIVLLGGLGGIRALVGLERQRDLDRWQLTLGMMADSKAKRLLDWQDSRLAALHELAKNGSVQLYSQTLQQGTSDNEPAQLAYLRNLILDTAQRHGFIESPGARPAIPANTSYTADAGLALFAHDLTKIAATPELPVVTEELKRAMTEAMNTGMASVGEITIDAQGRPLVSLIVPVFALQASAPSQGAIAVLLAINNASTALFPLLRPEAAVTKTDEALLVAGHEAQVVYLSPLADGTPPLAKALPLANDHLDAAQALAQPGSFVISHDYAGAEVLSISRPLPGLPWLLVQKITVSESLQESAAHQRMLTRSLLLALGLIAALFSAAWLYGSRLKERQSAQRERERASQLAAQTHLLSAINDNIGDALLLTKPTGEILFINRACASLIGLDNPNEASGKGLTATFGMVCGKQFLALIEQNSGQGPSLIQELSIEFNGETRQCHISCLSFPYLADGREAILFSLHDVTELNEARRRKELLLTQIVKALTRAIDQHDPHSANHSANTATLALAIAHRLGMTEDEIHVLDNAANLCNIGKLFVDKAILKKTVPLTSGEQAIIRQEPAFAQQILAGIDFSGPVLATIIQKNELLDGSGHPHGLRDGEIIPTARVLAAANAFVAMISPRAYRDRLSHQEAMSQLVNQGEGRYDRRVVAALFQVVENEIDCGTWQAKDRCVAGRREG